MKKKNKIISGVMAVTLAAGVGAYSYTAHAANPKTKITMETAVQSAVEKEAGTPSGVELDKERGAYVYEVEIQGKTKETEVKIDADSGKIINVKKEKLESEMSGIQPKISIEEAEKIAVEKVKGTLTEISLDHETGKLVYEAEVQSKTEEHEVEIDAETGKIIKVESESQDNENEDD